MRCLPIACAIVISLLGIARGEGLGVIAGGASPGDRAAIAAAVTDAVGPRGRVVGDAVAVARSAVGAGAVPVATLARFRRVREMIDDGWRAYLRVQIDVAQSKLAAARTEAEPLVALPGGLELYADAALRLGVVLHHRGLKDAAAVFALAIALDPDRPVTLAEFSPDIVDAIDAVRSAPVALQRVRVQTSPPGAIVSIDGKELGRAPLDVQVTRGQHLVVARAPFHRAAVQGVIVDDAASVAIALERDDEAALLAGGAEPELAERDQQRLVDTAIRFADVDELVIAAVTDRRGGPTLLVQRCGGAPAQCTAVVEIGYGDRSGLAAAARAAWQAAQGGVLRYPPSVIGDAHRGGPPSNRCEICRSPWLWGGVGAVVIGTVITLVVTSGSRPPPIVGVSGPAFGR